MDVYITKSNAAKILRKIDLNKIQIEGDVYKHKIYMFSRYEEKALLAYKELMKNPEEFITEIYVKCNKEFEEDTFWWVYENKSTPAYHCSPSCERLLSGYKNYKVPVAIRYKGIRDNENKEAIKEQDLNEEEIEIVKSNVKTYRRWFNDYEGYLKKGKEEEFLNHLNMTFQPEPRIRDMKALELANSGIVRIENNTLEEVEDKIDSLIKEAGKYYYADKKNTAILKQYSRYTSIAYTNKHLMRNETGFDENVVKEFLKDYDKRFKFPLKYYLREYYRIKYNPELKMNQKVLEMIGFHQCRCDGSQNQESNSQKLSASIDWEDLCVRTMEDPSIQDVQTECDILNESLNNPLIWDIWDF